jgi:hypothetical protein
MTMTTLELKNRAIGKINQINDDELLTEVIKLLDNSFDDSEIYQLSDKHKIAIEEAKFQISNGEILTDEQANKEINEWLNK